MNSRTAIAVGLLGVSLLTGCNNDGKTDSTNNQGSFEQTIARQTGEIQGLKDSQSKLTETANATTTQITRESRNEQAPSSGETTEERPELPSRNMSIR
ncbi:MAG: hypothetical protein AAAB35_25535 [Phyllobacterium sp.]|uniref:hypothetical protein n=1 Tax=Phyllobacterium sp. TaxID=1871046 RepID=UPI0030F1E9B8